MNKLFQYIQILKYLVLLKLKKTKVTWRLSIISLILIRLLYQWMRNMGLCLKKSLKDSHVVITGGGSGIGRQMAIMCAELGAKVSIWDINREAAMGVQKEIEQKNLKAFSQQCDITNIKEIDVCADQSQKVFGTVNVLINNAGIVNGKNILELNQQQINRCLQVNTHALHWTVQKFLPDMIKNNHGHIVTIASVAGLIGSPGLLDYSSSKFAAVGFNDALRQELNKLKSNVKTTLICPGFIDTGMFKGVKNLNFLIPMLKEKYAAWRIVNAIQQNETQVIMPYIYQIFHIIKTILPISVGDKIFQIFGGLDLMDEFKGREVSK